MSAVAKSPKVSKVGRVVPNAPWPMIPLGEVGRWFGGGTPSKSNSAYWTKGTIPWVSPKDMKQPLIDDAQDHITEKAVRESSTNMVEAGSVLVVARSGILQHTLPVAITTRPVALNQDIKAVKPNEGVAPAFLAMALKAFEREILHTCTKTGTTVQSLELPVFHRFQIPLPPLPDQRRIVSDIEKQFTRLDAGVAALRRTQANLKRYRAAVLKAACEGRLVPTEAELNRKRPRVSGSIPQPSATLDFESGAVLLGRILTERRKNWRGRGAYKEPTPPESKNLPPIPDGWVAASVGHILKIRNGFAFKSDDYCESGVPLIRQAELVGRLVVLDEAKRLPPRFLSECSEFVVHKGDLLIGMSGALGKISEYADETPALQNQRTGLLCIVAPIPPAFAKLVIQYVEPQIVLEGKGVAVQNVSAAEIENCVFMLPPLAEQARIVAEVERRLSVVEELETVVNANLQRATRLRQSILQQGFSGKLRVNKTE